MLEDVKKALRINNTAMDLEVMDLIDAAKMDMRILDINIDKVTDIGEMDPLIKRAITLYCKGHFGYDNPDAERFIASYEKLRDHLSLSIDYQASYVPENAFAMFSVKEI